ncbi:MAG: endo-1,4-beta-xylanase [Anaerolineae bacterium]|nr:endo-1,4-beta-xylanase [Anaerolineae bacterium]
MLHEKSHTRRRWFSPPPLFVALVSIASLLFPAGPRHNLVAADSNAVNQYDLADGSEDAVAQGWEPQSAAMPADVTATVIAEYNFDDDTPQGWTGRGDASVAVVSDTFRSSPNSLLTTGRTSNWHGPSVNVLSLLETGATYEISGCLRLVTGQPGATLRFSMERKPVGEATTWDWIVTSAADGVTDGAWVCLQGEYSFDTDVEALVLYVESDAADATAEFYLDDVTIVMTSPPPSEVIALYNFDDDTTQGWGPHGPITVTTQVVSDTFRSSPNSLLTTGRSAGWHGAEVDVTSLLVPGVTYEISGCVRLVSGEPASRLHISMQSTVLTDTTYTWIVRSAVDGVTDAEWTCLHGQYSAGTVDELILYVESNDAAATVEFYLDDVTILSPPQPPIQTDIPSVYETYSTTFLIGAALEPVQLNSVRHTQLLTYHFNSLTAENVMKPASIQPTEGNFDWTGADTLVQFARDNNMYVHGHTLEWHQQVPDWMFMVGGEPMTPTLANKALLLNRLDTHIRAVAGRYKDDINVWDVVNEVIDPAQTDCMRRNTWYEITGMDYISTAFNVAHEVVPTATLILNDYETTNPQKRECIYNVVSDLLDAGVPVEGIGMQLHINIQNPTPAVIEETIERFASLGVEVHITELDMSIYTSSSEAYATAGDVPEELLIAQGHRYKELFEVFTNHADDIYSVTFWGMADDHTWLTNRPIPRVDLPLLFDQQLQAKYAYWGIIDPDQLPVFIQQLNVPQGTPTIDGDSEFLWDMLSWAEVGATGALTASFQTRWDASHLYLFVDVEDATQDVTDTVDIFIDENNNKAGAYGSDDWHYMFQNGVISPSLDVSFSVKTDANGYQLEAAFPLSATASVGDRIGFDIRVTDGSSPASPISWNDLTHSQDTDTTNWGTLILIDAMKSTFALEATPVIDAIKDPVWDGADEISTDVWVEGTSGSTATVKTLWDSEHLYVYAVVNDSLLSKVSSNAWEQDSIEVFVDQNNAKTTSYQADDGQFRVNFVNEQSFRGTAASTATLTSATRIITTTSVVSPSEVITTGYVVELAVTLNDVPPQQGGVIGFDFQVNNDEDGDGVRDSVAIWNDPTGQSYQNTSRLGVLTFFKRVAILPLVMRNY